MSLAQELAYANVIIFYAYDRQSNVLRASHSYGLNRNAEGFHRISAAHGLCGRVFSSGKSELVVNQYQNKNYLRDINFYTELSVQFMDGKLEIPSSAAAVPVSSCGCKYGILAIIGGVKEGQALSHNDVAAADQYAKIIALHEHFDRINSENAHMREELALIENIFKHEEDTLIYSSFLSRLFSTAFLRGDEFYGMLKLAESHASFAFAIYNMFLERLSWTESAADMSLPDNIMELWEAHPASKQWRAAQDRGYTLYLMPVQYGGVVHGILAAWTKRSQISKKDRILLEVLASYLSMVWFKMAVVKENDRNLKSELLTGILSGKQDNAFLTKAKMLGLEKNSRFFVILISVPGVTNHVDYCDKEDGIKLLMELEKIMSEKCGASIILPEHSDICIIASCSASGIGSKRYDNLVNNVITKITETAPDLTIGGSRVYETIYNVRKCYWEASQCLIIIRKYLRHKKSLNYLDMGVSRLLLTKNTEEDIETFIEDILKPVLDYDKDHNSDLAATLFYYARLNKSAKLVSDKLDIHPNTLYQRIRKTEELLGYDLKSPTNWFDIQAASIMYGLIYTDLITKL